MCDSEDAQKLQESEVKVSEKGGGSELDRGVQSCPRDEVQQEVVEPLLTLTVNDHHFAPGPETLNAVYTSRNLTDDRLILTVRGTQYGGDVVYRVEDVANGDGNHDVNWQGGANQGALNGLLLTPLHSPYTMRIEAENAGLSDEKTFHVLYHSIELGLGTYTADAQAPDDQAEPEKWVQYRLNQLGYLAGPVDGNLGDQSKRAMARYAYQHPTLNENRALVRGAAFHTNVDFRQALTNGEQPRTLIEGGQLPAPGETAKLWLDHNYYYYELDDFSRPHGHVELDRRKLDRWEHPLEVQVKLLSRTDADGSGQGVDSPLAVGEVEVQWVVRDVVENTTSIQRPSVDCPTRAKAYVDQALLATWDQGTESDNCPAALGGARQAPGEANRGYFRLGVDQPAPFTVSNVNDAVYSNVHQGASVAKRGRAGAIFRASYVAGDGYHLTARLSFRGLANENALQQEHTNVLGGPWNEKLAVETGNMVLWRRHRVTAVINWPAPANALAIDWTQVAPEYEYAYCHLDHGAVTTITGTQFVQNYAGAASTRVFGRTMALDMNGQADPPLPIDGTAVFPMTIPAQGSWQTAGNYRAAIDTHLRQRITLQNRQQLAEWVALAVWQQHPPGAIIIHLKWVPTLRVQHHALGGLLNGDTEDWDPALFCVGLSRGVTVYAHTMFPEYSDQFLISHEMGHSRFLKHHETAIAPQVDPHGVNNASDNPDDHDLRDHNCTMCYPFGIPSRPDLQWSRNGPKRSAFCGKCLLKLRGWDVVDATLPRQSP